MRILGISALHSDGAAALVVDGKIVAAALEERFTRLARDKRFPHQAIDYCLTYAGIRLNDIDVVAFHERPLSKLGALIDTYSASAPRGFGAFRRALPAWFKMRSIPTEFWIERLSIHQNDDFDADKLQPVGSSPCRAASAYFPSPYDEAAVLTLDGLGETDASPGVSFAVGRGRSLQVIKDVPHPHSLGRLYAAVAGYIGLKSQWGGYELLQLAPSGRPIFADAIREILIDIKDDGSFRLDAALLHQEDVVPGELFDRLFGGTQRAADLAASVQTVIEEVLVKLGRRLRHETRVENLCLGSSPIDSLAKGRLLREDIFNHVWMTPAAYPSDVALGAALFAYLHRGGARPSLEGARDRMSGAYLGPEFTQAEIQDALTAAGARFTVFEEEDMLDTTAQALCEGQRVGWFNGRRELGSRGLG
ncbi:MAG: carbamoyltransferase N-terminal domain-containing protein, partial [Myxococcota bacterium]